MYCRKCNADMEFDELGDCFVPASNYEFTLENQVNELIASEKIDENEGDLMFSMFFDCKHEISGSVASVATAHNIDQLLEGGFL